jgi:hypothetical protein
LDGKRVEEGEKGRLGKVRAGLEEGGRRMEEGE